ncbi:conserved hypothetical protein [Ricinus communis]|uniref:Uncharacterized protein n=1 Tax=Ricinus communis TaxID=3988 RepID=B9SLX6_RICCO|nr:conserved hypothetical protein [Ricinus communis]
MPSPRPMLRQYAYDNEKERGEEDYPSLLHIVEETGKEAQRVNGLGLFNLEWPNQLGKLVFATGLRLRSGLFAERSMNITVKLGGMPTPTEAIALL